LYFILGQGLAGTLLAFRFLENNIPFRIFDNGFKSSSSMVAAGLWNPIVFKRITKSWMADELIAELNSFYPKIEHILDVSFFHPSENIRLHSSMHEQKEWGQRMDESEFKNYLFIPESLSKVNELFKPKFGYGKVAQTGNINLSVLLTAASAYFSKHGLIKKLDLALPENILDLDKFEIDGLIPKKIIDCRGAVSATSPWWDYLPFKLAKGEVLTVECPGLELNNTLNSGIFILPQGNNIYKIGSTFNWEDLNQTPSEAGKKELTDKFEKLVGIPYKIIHHQAGVRPSVADRRPLLGTHPECKKLVIFNGLGTKGIMIAPYFSAHLVEFLNSGKNLTESVNIDRFNKRYIKYKRNLKQEKS